ncbi:MAG: hypothetical protein K0S39_302 [Paenibacillus sp.]|jgi:hypothetical protein|nr:hypothetical protein [Paenibacillus sp.]
MTEDTVKYKSGERVDRNGVYADEWGRTELFKEDEFFSENPQMGSTYWRLVRYPFDSQQTGETVDMKFRNQAEVEPESD